MTTIRDLQVADVRFPTSRDQHGSDAMNPDPDYSAAYVTLQAEGPHVGNGLAFTLGRGTELCVAAIEALRQQVVGRSLDEITRDFAGFWRQLTSDSQLRWLGPEKGVVHLATAAVINAVWDLWAKRAGKPLWQLLCDLSDEQLVGCIDFRYITDALSPAEAREILGELRPSRTQRVAELQQHGYPAYTTSAGWLGYSDGRLRQLCRQAVAEHWPGLKIKVGADLAQDIHRLEIVREEIGPNRYLMLDANQVWDVDAAIAWMQRLAQFEPFWIEEPTCPDDILGHARIRQAISPIGVATGEAGQNRVLFKQLLQAQAIDFCQIDSCRLGGVNEVLAVLLLAAKFRVPVCPHGGGVGLCEQIQHLAIFDYVAVSGSLDHRMAEYVDHLHEHFAHPVLIRNGRYEVPQAPGYSTQLLPASVAQYRFPEGPVWNTSLPSRAVNDTPRLDEPH